MVSGNVSSYTRVLNGPMQLDKILTFNQLAATMTTLKNERDQAKAETSARRKQQEKEKAARKAEKEREAINKQNELAPLCKAHVDQELDHVLSLTVKQRREILRYHFQMATVEIDGVSKAINKLKLAETGIALQRLMPVMPQLPAPELEGDSIQLNGDGDNDVGMNVAEENGVESNAGGINGMVEN